MPRALFSCSLAGLCLLSTSISALAAGTALVIGSDSSGTAGAGLKLRLEHAGYTVTTVADGTGPLVYDQVWDVRISPALIVAAQSHHPHYMTPRGTLFPTRQSLG